MKLAAFACAFLFAAPLLADPDATPSVVAEEGVEETRQQDPWFRAGREAVAKRLAHTPWPGPARNLILFLGDGMGISTVTAARIFAGQQRGAPGEEAALSFESFSVIGLVKVYNTDQQVPDSAGTMTAIMSGVKTKAGMLGVSADVVPGDHTSVARSRVPTLIEEAEDRGLATGLVTTTRITHATPAACYAHSASRGWEADADLSPEALKDGFPDLALQLVEFAHGDGIDVVFGGGRANFLGANQSDPEDLGETGRRFDERNLLAEWRKAAPGRSVVWSSDQLAALSDRPGTRQVLGLFERNHMEYEHDRETDTGGEPSLARMTEFAIHELARRDTGFVLVVEGGRIDHAHHANNAYRALGEAIELSQAVEVAVAMTDPTETLIVVTADHGHPLTLAGYATRGNPILGLVHSSDPFTGARQDAPARDGTGLPYTTLQYAIGPGHHAPTDVQPEGPKRFPHEPLEVESPTQPSRPDLGEVDVQDPDVLQQAAVARFAGVHSGEDVAVWADGPAAALLSGSLEQSTIYHAIVEALGWNAAPGEDEAASAQ